MRTEAQKNASRINGAKSNGPVTPEGKSISCQNAVRHGCTAQNVLLANEDPLAFLQLSNVYYDKFKPADGVEKDFVDEMVIAKWRLRRDWSNEAALLDLQIELQSEQIKKMYKKIDPAGEYAAAFKTLADESKALVLASRYETTHRRAFYRALTGLLQLRAAMPPVPENNSCETNPAPNDPQPPQPVKAPAATPNQPPTPESPVEPSSEPVPKQAEPVPSPLEEAKNL